VLTRATLGAIREKVAHEHSGFVRDTPNYPLTVYAEQSRLTPSTLEQECITFKQTPYDVKARM
jgi:adenine-specific DNA-methyltransferase